MPGASSLIPRLFQDPPLHNPQLHAESISRTATRMDLLERPLGPDPGSISHLQKAGVGCDQDVPGFWWSHLYITVRTPAPVPSTQECYTDRHDNPFPDQYIEVAAANHLHSLDGRSLEVC